MSSGPAALKPEPLPAPVPDLATAIRGTWWLVSREDYASDGKRRIDPILGADPLGILAFAPGRFAAQFMNRRRATPDGSVPIPTVAGSNNSCAIDGYDAYFGTYTLDTTMGRIEVTLEGSLSREHIGLTMTRDIRVAGDQLLIRLATTAIDGTPITRTLTFERIG